MVKHFTVRASIALLILLMLLFAAYTVVRLPMLGVADNGDYWRVMLPAGLDHTAAREEFLGEYVRKDFRYSDLKPERLLSSASIVVMAARWIYRTCFPGKEFFDLRAVGLLYFFLFLLATSLLLRAFGLSILSLFLIWIMVDPNYLLFFNSLFVEGIFFVLLLSILALIGLWESRKPPHTEVRRTVLIGSGMIFLVALAGFSKHAYMLLPITLFFTLVFSFMEQRRAPRRSEAAILLCLLAASIACPLVGHLRRDTEPLAAIYRMNNYQSVFFGIGRASSEPKSVLQELQIPEKYWHLNNTHLFQSEPSERTPELYATLAKVSRFHLLALWLRDTKATLTALKEI